MSASASGNMLDAAARVSAAQLQDLPAEILIEIFSGLDFDAFDNMRLVNRRLRSVIQSHWISILPGIIETDFAPFQDLFDSFWNMDLPDCMTCSQLLSICGTVENFQPLLSFCRVVRRWEAEFPRLRFVCVPEHSRILHPHELRRLRRGLYFWWRFARAFHGPAPCVDSSSEAQRAFVRRLSTTQLHEVFDMWETIRKAVGWRVCPSVSTVRGLGVSDESLVVLFYMSGFCLTDWGSLLSRGNSSRTRRVPVLGGATFPKTRISSIR